MRQSTDSPPETQYRIAATCPDCGEALRLRHNRRTQHPFLGCADYPACTFAEPVLPELLAGAAARQALEKEINILLDHIRGQEMEITIRTNAQGAAEAERRRLLKDLEAAQAEISSLKSMKQLLEIEVHCLRQIRPARQHPALEKELKALVALAHPDKWHDHPCATAITKALLDTRARLTGGGK